MKLGIINSAFQQAGVDTATGLRHIARIGFDTVDIFTEAVGISKKEVSLVAKTTEKLGLPIVSLPVVAVGLIDFNDPVREFHVERCKKYIDLAKTWGAKNILLVLGEYIWQREVIPAEAQWQWGIETCRRLGDYADKRKIDIALELEPFRLSLLNNVPRDGRVLWMNAIIRASGRTLISAIWFCRIPARRKSSNSRARPSMCISAIATGRSMAICRPVAAW